MTYAPTAQTEMADAYIKSATTSESQYTEMRDKLVATGRLLDKHHKTADAAREEADAAYIEWKAALRAAGGDISKSARELNRNEVAARETAEEFGQLATELEAEFRDLQTLTGSLRRVYLQAFERVARTEEKQRLEDLAGAVFSTESGREFLSLLLHQAEQRKADYEEDPGVQELLRAAPAANGISFQEAEQQILGNRVKDFVYSVIEKQAQYAGSPEYRRESRPIAKGPYEIDPTEVGPRAAGQAASRLRAMGILE